MSNINLNALDNVVIHLLTKNGRMPIEEMAKKTGVTGPTVRKRIKLLQKKGMFNVSGLIDPGRHRETITALVAMSIRSE